MLFLIKPLSTPEFYLNEVTLGGALDSFGWGRGGVLVAREINRAVRVGLQSCP